MNTDDVEGRMADDRQWSDEQGIDVDHDATIDISHEREAVEARVASLSVWQLADTVDDLDALARVCPPDAWRAVIDAWRGLVVDSEMEAGE